MKNKENTDENCFKDIRGSIHFFVIEGVKFHITVTKAGMLRGGDFHPDIQRDIILKGKFEITTRQNNKDIIKEYSTNDLIEIPPHIPHMFRSLTDTVMLEWRDGEYKSEYFPPYRKQIEEQSKKLNQ